MRRFLIFIALMLFPALASGQTSQIPQQCVGSSSTTAETCTTLLVVAAKDVFVFTPGATNTGAFTLAINGGSAMPVLKWLGTPLASGDLLSGIPLLASTDGTNVYVMTIGNVPTGTGNVNAGSSLFTGGPVASSNNTTGVAASSAYLDCSQFSGADWTLKVQACLSALNTLNSTAGVADARGIAAGGTTGSVNPEGGTMPASGTLLLGPGTYSINVPFVDHGDWSVQGISTRGVDTSVGTTVKAGASFQATYTTGTITVGTVGASETITGSGTTWTSSMIGCGFYGANGGSNSTFGIITAVGSTTSLTLGWGTNLGSGAAGGSSYTIACPVHAHGSGGSTSNGDQYGMMASNINFDCNAVAGCIGDLNWYGNQGTGGSNVGVHNSINIGLDLENQIQNSGPWDRYTVSMGSGCSSSAIPIVIHANINPFKGLTNPNVSKGACSTSPAVGIDVAENGALVTGADVASVGIGVLFGANTSCPVACAMPGRATNGWEVDNIYAESTVTTAIESSNAFSTNQGFIIRNITNSGTNALIDLANSCTDNTTRLGNYTTNSAGAIQNSSSSVAGCLSSSGGIGGSATVGYEPVMVTNTTTIATSPCDHGVTTANTMTCSDSAGAKFGTTVATTSDGVHPGASSYPGNTTLPSLPANTVSIVGPPSATLTSWSLQLPTAIPTTTDLFSCVVTGTNCLLTDTGIASANVVTLAGSQTLTNKSISLTQINSGLTSGGVVCATSTTAISMTSALTSNVFPKGGGAGICPTNSSVTDNGTTVTTTDAGGYVAPVFVANGTTAGFFDFPQGSTSAAVAPCNVANSICEQAPTSVTSYMVTKPGAAPNIASYKQTDGCAAAACTETFHPVPVLLTVASDFTDSTSTSLQLITGLSTTLPVSKAVVVSFHCGILFDQATAVVSDQFGIGVTGTAPTQANAGGEVFITASTVTAGTLTALASTTPTSVVTFTPGVATTIYRAELDGTIEQPSNATPGVLGIYVATTTGTDNIIVKRGTYCSVIYQ